MTRYNFIACTLVLVLGMSLLFTGNALASNITINPIEDRDLALDPNNYTVEISGSAQMPEVTLKLFQEEALIYFDVLKPENGRYSVSIQLPTTIPDETTFTVVAGLGTETDSVTFKFFRSASDSDRGGNSGGSSDVPTPKPAPKEGCPSVTLNVEKGKAAEAMLCQDVQISIPEGAVTQATTFSFNRMDTVPQDLTKATSCKRDVISVFEVKQDPKVELGKPAQLIFLLDEQKIRGKEVYLYYYSETTDTWLNMEALVEKDRLAIEQIKLYKQYALVVADPIPSFNDITGHWAQKDIEEAVCLGLVKGYSDQTFRPDRSISRLEFSVILHRALRIQGEQEALTFKDSELIPSWATAEISRAVQAGLILGYDDHTFRPHQSIRRSEIALMLVRAIDANVRQGAITTFKDDPDIPIWSNPSVAKAVELGLIKGRNGNLFAPQANTTRAEATVLTLRMLNMLK